MRPLVLLSGLAEGGAERVAVALLARLREQGRDVSLCTLTRQLDGGPARRLAECGVPRFDLGARRLLDPAALLRFAGLLRRERFDLVHAHGQDATLLAAAERLLPGGPPLALTRHVLDEPAGDRRSRWRARLCLSAYRHADAVTAVSRAAADRLARSSGLARRAIRVLPNGIELERFGDAATERAGADLRAELGGGGEELLLACVAVLRPGKGHEALLDAVLRLRARSCRIRLVLAGDGPLAATLGPRCAASGEVVRWLGARTDVPALLAACDAVALASESEALPTALIEAAAAGRPVVATAVGGTPEVVEDELTGLLVPPGDAFALESAIERLAAEPALRERLGRAARRRAEERFSVALQAERTWELWSELVGEAR